MFVLYVFVVFVSGEIWSCVECFASVVVSLCSVYCCWLKYFGPSVLRRVMCVCVCVARREAVMCYVFPRVVYESRSLASDTRPCLPIYVFIARLAAVTPFSPFDSSLVLCWRWASFSPGSLPRPSLCPATHLPAVPRPSTTPAALSPVAGSAPLVLSATRYNEFYSLLRYG